MIYIYYETISTIKSVQLLNTFRSRKVIIEAALSLIIPISGLEYYQKLFIFINISLP